MPGVVEFLIKMKDGMSGPLTNVATSSTVAKSAIDKLTMSGTALQGMAAKATEATSKLSEGINKLDGLKESMPANVQAGFAAIQGQLPGAVSAAFGGLTSFITNPFVIAGGAAMTAIVMGMKASKEKADFTDLLGLGKGGKVYDDLRKMRTLLGDEVVASGKSLLDAGTAADKVAPELRSLGDVANGNKENFTSLSAAFATVQKEGHLTTDSLKTLVDAGFKPLTILQQKMGGSDAMWQKKLADGAVSADMLAQALQIATDKGGEFYGNMDKLAGAPTAKWNEMKAQVEDMAIKFGSYFVPLVEQGGVLLGVAMAKIGTAVGWVSDRLTDLCTWADKNSDTLITLAGVVAGGAAAYMAYSAWQKVSYLWMMREAVGSAILAVAKGGLASVIGVLTIAQEGLNAAFLASPIGWIVLGVGALVGGILYAWKHFEGFRKVIYGVWETFKAVFTDIGNLFKQIFSPIGEAIAAIKEGRWMDAAKATGKLLFNVTPVGMAVNAAQFVKGGGFSDLAAARDRGMAKGEKSWNDSQADKAKKKETPEEKLNALVNGKKGPEDAKTPGANTQAGLNAVSGGGAKNIIVTVGKMIEKLEIRIEGGVKETAADIERIVEEAMVRAIASATAR